MGRDLTELNKLEEYLKEHGIRYEREDLDNTFSGRIIQGIFGEYAEVIDKHRIVVYVDGRRSWDVICHKGGCGCDQGLLEGMGDIFGPDVEGWLTAEDVIERIEAIK